MSSADPEEETTEQLLASKVSIPGHVVFRAFAQETVILNLQTGTYHGLDRVGGRLFELLPSARNLRAAARQLAEEYDQPAEEVEVDALELCLSLCERGLVGFEPA
jgi:hypothetical protein